MSVRYTTGVTAGSPVTVALSVADDGAGSVAAQLATTSASPPPAKPPAAQTLVSHRQHTPLTILRERLATAISIALEQGPALP